MKKIALAAVFMAAVPAAQANFLFTVGAKANVWNAEATGQLDKGLSVEKEGLNLGSDNGTQLTVFFEHPLPMIPNVKIKNTNLELDGKGQANAEFAGQSFSTDVQTVADLSHTDFTLYWGLFLPLPYISADFGLTLRQFNGEASVTEISNPTNSKSVDLDMTLPLAYGAVKVGSPFGIYAAADVNYIGFGKNTLTDMSATIGYDLPLPIPLADLALEVGYRSMSLQTDKKDVKIDSDFDTKGVFFGASLSVGF